VLGVDVSGPTLASQRRGGSDGHHGQPAMRKPLIALMNTPHRGIALQGTASVSRHIDAEPITAGQISGAARLDAHAARQAGTASVGTSLMAASWDRGASSESNG